MPTYSNVAIIYNPNSTGDSASLAKKTKKILQQALPKLPIEVVPTEYAGHAEQLAYDLARASKRPLIISSSGDGGYHEVINGIMRARREGGRAVAGLLPGGNANDHYHSLHSKPLLEQMNAQKTLQIDLLKLTATRHGKPYEQYAHSYIGFGLTPRVGRALTKVKLNHFNQAWIVTKSLLGYKSTRLRIGGKVKRIHSLVFSNTNRMARFLSFSSLAEITDGKFEVSIHYRQHKARFVFSLLKATVKSFDTHQQASHYSFYTVHPTLVQMDGETTRLDARTKVLITIEACVLECIV